MLPFSIEQSLELFILDTLFVGAEKFIQRISKCGTSHICGLVAFLGRVDPCYLSKRQGLLVNSVSLVKFSFDFLSLFSAKLFKFHAVPAAIKYNGEFVKLKSE